MTNRRIQIFLDKLLRDVKSPKKKEANAGTIELTELAQKELHRTSMHSKQPYLKLSSLKSTPPRREQ